MCRSQIHVSLLLVWYCGVVVLLVAVSRSDDDAAHIGGAADGGWLQILFTNTNGMEWFSYCRGDWNMTPGANPCDGNTSLWSTRITCDDFGRVSTLSLIGCNLRGALVEWNTSSGAMSQLLSINFASNRMNGTLPASLGHLSSLQELNYGSNQCDGPIPESFGSLRRLQLLSLENNQLNGTLPESLRNLISLQHVYMSDNLLEGTLPSYFEILTSLQSMLFTRNRLTGSIPEVFGALSSLKFLDFAGNQLGGILPLSMGALVSLQYVDLSGNNMSGSLLESFGNLSSLQYLSLRGNQFSGTIPSSFGSLGSLQTLDLGSNQLTGSLPFPLCDLRSLMSMRMSFNRLTGTLPSTFSRLSSLREVALDNNQFTGGYPSAWIDQLQSLRSDGLRLQRNCLDFEGISSGELVWWSSKSVSASTLTPQRVDCGVMGCAGGRYFRVGSASCVTCPSDAYCPDGGNVSIPCPAGTRNGRTGQGQPSACKTFTPTMDAEPEKIRTLSLSASASSALTTSASIRLSHSRDRAITVTMSTFVSPSTSQRSSLSSSTDVSRTAAMVSESLSSSFRHITETELDGMTRTESGDATGSPFTAPTTTATSAVSRSVPLSASSVTSVLSSCSSSPFRSRSLKYATTTGTRLIRDSSVGDAVANTRTAVVVGIAASAALLPFTTLGGGGPAQRSLLQSQLNALCADTSRSDAGGEGRGPLSQEPLDVPSSPTRLRIGSGPTRFFLGAVLGNLLLLLVIVIVAYLSKLLSRHSLLDPLPRVLCAKLRALPLPGWAVHPGMLLLQPTVSSIVTSTVSLWDEGEPSVVAISICCFGVVCVVGGGMSIVWVVVLHFGAEALQPRRESTPAGNVSFALRLRRLLFSPSWRWRDACPSRSNFRTASTVTERSRFVCRFRPMFCDYRKSMHGYLCVEFVASVACGVAGGLLSHAECSVELRWSVAVINIAVFLCGVALRPHNYHWDSISSITSSSVGAVWAACMVSNSEQGLLDGLTMVQLCVQITAPIVPRGVAGVLLLNARSKLPTRTGRRCSQPDSDTTCGAQSTALAGREAKLCALVELICAYNPQSTVSL